MYMNVLYYAYSFSYYLLGVLSIWTNKYTNLYIHAPMHTIKLEIIKVIISDDMKYVRVFYLHTLFTYIYSGIYSL